MMQKKSFAARSAAMLTAMSLLAACQGSGSTAGNQPDAAKAGGDFSDVVKERQANFKAISKANKAAKAAFEGENPAFGDIATAAATMSANGAKITGHFPAGSGPESGEKTEALASIWAKPAEFQQATDKFVTATNTLKAAADAKNAAGVEAAIKSVGVTCKECHKAFREDKK
jgi:cytochrome c556